MAALVNSTPAKSFQMFFAAMTGSPVLDYTTGWPSSYGRLKPDSNRCIAFKDSGGRGAEASIGIDYPNLQVLGRGAATDYDELYIRMTLVRDAILGIPEAPAEFPELVSVTQRGHITDMGYDDKNRPMLSLNFNLIVDFGIAGTFRE